MGTTAGIVCKKDGFGVTVLSPATAEDHDITVPANISDRGAQLAWLLEEARRIFAAHTPEVVYVQRAGSGMGSPSPERHEVEAVVQIAAHQVSARRRTLTRDQVRAAMGVPKARGAYESLLARPEVKSRSNAQRRDQYLLALAARS